MIERYFNVFRVSAYGSPWREVHIPYCWGMWELLLLMWANGRIRGNFHEDSCISPQNTYDAGGGD
jgi:hypothetical protein